MTSNYFYGFLKQVHFAFAKIIPCFETQWSDWRNVTSDFANFPAHLKPLLSLAAVFFWCQKTKMLVKVLRRVPVWFLSAEPQLHMSTSLCTDTAKLFFYSELHLGGDKKAFRGEAPEGEGKWAMHSFKKVKVLQCTVEYFISFASTNSCSSE